MDTRPQSPAVRHPTANLRAISRDVERILAYGPRPDEGCSPAVHQRLLRLYAWAQELRRYGPNMASPAP